MSNVAIATTSVAHTLLKWLNLWWTASNNHHNVHRYILLPQSKTVWTSRFPFVRRVSKHYRPASARDDGLGVVRAYPVDAGGRYSTTGKYTIVYNASLAPPVSRSGGHRILSASLEDVRTCADVDVTRELVRLAGPRFDYFGFSYPLQVITPWLCESVGMHANSCDIRLSLCMDETYHVVEWPA